MECQLDEIADISGLSNQTCNQTEILWKHYQCTALKRVTTYGENTENNEQVLTFVNEEIAEYFFQISIIRLIVKSQ